ncbi:hypothetical protein Nepgr_000628 [Nepenthes gracilis]|uniref:Uncharacterized protein n=1 Tax=Nepenthes gracilis TaxID=150966 RepID=A0AAD3RWC8_NEPGR|nr:hypothetical protein Nepgr_000628 [Nepenthes gracilis]
MPSLKLLVSSYEENGGVSTAFHLFHYSFQHVTGFTWIDLLSLAELVLVSQPREGALAGLNHHGLAPDGPHNPSLGGPLNVVGPMAPLLDNLSHIPSAPHHPEHIYPRPMPNRPHGTVPD